jgi:hypothetical protein
VPPSRGQSPRRSCAIAFLCDPPAARRLACDSAADRKPHAGVGIGDEVLSFDQFKQVKRRRGEIRRRLWKLFDPQSGFGEPLRNGLHLPRIEKHFAQIEALPKVQQCSFDRRFENRAARRDWAEIHGESLSVLAALSYPTLSRRWQCYRA